MQRFRKSNSCRSDHIYFNQTILETKYISTVRTRRMSTL